jgi:ABC-type transporter Mla MlaB component
MPLRIDCSDLEGAAAVRVAGELSASGATELADLVRRCRGTVTVDLDQLVSVDAAACAILRTLRDQGTRFVGASPYIRMLMDRDVRNRIQP